MTNEELVELVQKGINVQNNLGILYEQNKRFICAIVKPFMKYAEAEDLLQEGYIGFQEAVFSYNPGEAKLVTHAAWKIRQYCLAYIRTYIKVNQKKPISLSSPTSEDESLTLGEMIADNYNMEESVQESMMTDHKRQVLDSAIQQLGEKEQSVITHRYWEGESQKDIAAEMELSVSRISQIEKTALKKMKRNDHIVELMEDVYGYDSIRAYRMSVKGCVDRRTSSTESLALKRIDLEMERRRNHADVDDILINFYGMGC